MISARVMIWWAALMLLNIAAISLARCDDGDESISNCSARGKGQYWDGKKWTCKGR